MYWVCGAVVQMGILKCFLPVSAVDSFVDCSFVYRCYWNINRDVIINRCDAMFLSRY